MKTRIVTLNAGLLSLLGGRVQVAPFVEERAAGLPSQLRSLDANLVALQEVYRQRHRELILSRLQDLYPYSLYERKKRHFGLENGLMVLSKAPITGNLVLFRTGALDERLFDSKGALVCIVDFGASRELTLVNVHTTAGGAWVHPEAARSNAWRSAQIDQILSAAQTGRGVRVIVGDLNAGPGVSEENFQQVIDGGYLSVHDLLHGKNGEITWDPRNRLNLRGPHRACPPQRIDHIFIRKDDLASHRLQPVSSAICCREKAVPLPTGRKVTVSDHFGLLVELEWQD